MGKKYKKRKSAEEQIIGVVVLLMIVGSALAALLPLAIVGLVGYGGYRLIKRQLTLSQAQTAQRIQNLKDTIKVTDQKLQLLDQHLKNKAYEDYQNLSRQLLPQLSSIQTEATNLRAKMGEQVYGRISSKVTQVTGDITSTLDELSGLLAVSKEERQIEQLAPEILASYRNIKRDDELIREKIKQADNRAELSALHAANMNRFEDILEGYLKIKRSPKDFYNADERLALAKTALEQFDVQLDKTLQELNESDLADFEISLRLMNQKEVDNGL